MSAHTPSFQATQIITRPDATAALRVRRAQLKIGAGPDKGRSINIQHPGVVIGTGSHCDLVLTDHSVSRQQVQICPCEQGFRIRDMESKNGTFLGDVQIGDIVATSNIAFSAGLTRFALKILSGHDEYPLSETTHLGELKGRSIAMRRVFAVLERAAEIDATLLLEGESGTGKDVAARTVHVLSARRQKPFIVVDCGAIARELIESELFGHRKGAFTGAERDREGAFEAARGGTLFLDEIGELPSALQPRLLRVLEQREIKRLGENTYRPIDVRLLAATNRDLKNEVACGRFREDLFYRLTVVSVRMPALRERREDITLLARAFAQLLAPESDPLEIIPDPVAAMLASYDWPGNVRELRNVVERLLMFPNNPDLALARAPTNSLASVNTPGELYALPFHQARSHWNDRFECEYLAHALDAAGGVIAQAARQADIPRQTFHRLMVKHQLVKT